MGIMRKLNSLYKNFKITFKFYCYYKNCKESGRNQSNSEREMKKMVVMMMMMKMGGKMYKRNSREIFLTVSTTPDDAALP